MTESRAAESSRDDLFVEKRGGTLTLTLNRPRRMNALSAHLVNGLSGAISAAYRDNTRLLVLRGIGKNFSAGFDMADYEDESEGDLVLRFIRIEQLLQKIQWAPFDTLALARGRNVGAGVDLIGACARRVATPEASFRMPGLRFDLVLGSRLFAHRVGCDRARDVLQLSQTFGAPDAYTWGFLTKVATVGQWTNVVNDAEAAAKGLSANAAAQLFRVTRQDSRDADLAEVVRSASQPGLKARIAGYLAHS